MMAHYRKQNYPQSMLLVRKNNLAGKLVIFQSFLEMYSDIKVVILLQYEISQLHFYMNLMTI